jgi:L-rhamnose mutarotase
MNRFCYALDLIDDSKLIQEYINYHQKVWPEIKQSILDSGIELMEIYCVGNRLFMITDVNENFSFDKKSSIDGLNNKIQEWEKLMWKYQQKLPFAKEGEKWVLMESIYQQKNK